jgi:heme O synthase-like polyprenyltransferase
MTDEARPAFYALESGGWRDYVSLLHPPYTAWHLAYVAIGGALAPRTDWPVLGLTLLAFLLAMGIGAHALDELRSRPLRTRIPSRALIALAIVSIAAASGIGIAVAVQRSLWLIVFIAFGAFIVVAYNLELFGGRFHSDLWFGLAWGGFPVLTGYFAVAGRIRVDALLAAAFAVLLSLAQRVLSTPVRQVRRSVESVTGTITYRDGTSRPLSADALTASQERALKLLAAATVLLAGALVARRFI